MKNCYTWEIDSYNDGKVIPMIGWQTFLSHPQEDPVIEQINELGNLEAGWDCGRGSAISKDVIAGAIKIANLILAYDLKSEVHPNSNGGINIGLYSDDIFLDIIINPDLSISLVKEAGIGFDYTTIFEEENVSEDELISQTKILAFENSFQCFSFEQYTFGDTTHTNDDLAETPSVTTREESPFSIKTVPSAKTNKEFVDTLAYSIAE